MKRIKLTNTDIHRHLAERREIAIIWTVEDIESVRPGLTAEQAWNVLQEVERNHDSEVGINWDVLHYHATSLFGFAPDDHDDGGTSP